MLAQLDARPVPSVAGDILEQLATFYEAPENLGDQEEVSYSLIDVDSAPVVVHPLGSLVDELISARRRRSIASRAALLEASHASPGDAALLDVGVMCSELAQVDGRLAAVAADLDDAVRQLVVGHRPGDSRLLQGASIFYFPGDPEIRLKSIVAPVIFAGDYHRLRLSIDADWDRIACELMPDIELLDRFSEGREAMPRDGDDKGSGFGPLTNAADQVMFDIRKLQQFLGRLAAAVNQSDSRDGVLQDFKSRQGTGVRSLVADLQDVASNLRANMEVLQAVIEKREPATDRYVVDRRTSGPAGQRGSANRRERPNVPMPHASDVRLGDLVVHVERAG
jgi:hypothetical protein